MRVTAPNRNQLGALGTTVTSAWLVSHLRANGYDDPLSAVHGLLAASQVRPFINPAKAAAPVQIYHSARP